MQKSNQWLQLLLIWFPVDNFNEAVDTGMPLRGLPNPRLPMPLVAALLLLGALITVVAWSVSSPPGSTPDEDFHLGSIWCPRPAEESCEVAMVEEVRGGQIEEVPAIWIPSQTAFANCNAPVSIMSAACFDMLSPIDYTWSTRFDTGYYPVGFYRAMNLLTQVGHNLVSTVFTMRIVNGSLSVLLFAVAAFLFTHQNRRLMAYALLAVLAPTALYLIISINPSGWGISGVTLAWLGIHGFLTEKVGWRSRSLLVVGAIGALLAASARGDAGLAVSLAALAAVVLHWHRFRRDWRLLIAPVAVAAIGIIGFLTSGQVGSAAEGLAEDGPGGYLLNNALELPAFLIDAIVGPLNWLDTPLPAISRIPVIMLVAAVAFVGMRQMDFPKALALLGLFFSLTALPLIILEISGTQLGLYFQARYLTPIIPLIMLTALWNPHSGKVARFSQPQLWVIWATLATGHAWALHTQILRFTHGLAIRWWNLNYAPEWWAFGVSPMATWVLGALGFALLLLGLFAVSARGHHTQFETQSELNKTELTLEPAFPNEIEIPVETFFAPVLHPNPPILMGPVEGTNWNP